MHIVLTLIFIAIFLYFYSPVTLWMQAHFSGTPISFKTIFSMRSRKIPAHLIVNTKIKTAKAGIPLSIDQLETHYNATRELQLIYVAKALIIAKKAGIPLTFDEATAIDLAGGDILRSTRASVCPEVVDIPEIRVTTKDGKTFTIESKVTMRAVIEKILNGERQETICTKIASAISKHVSEIEKAPNFTSKVDKITRQILKENHDQNGAWTVLSIDICSIIAE